MPKYEWQTITTHGDITPARFNELIKDDWELVAITQYVAKPKSVLIPLVYYFKREAMRTLG